MTTDFVLDALEQALYARQPGEDGTLIHHSDRGSQRGNPSNWQTLEWVAWYNHHRLMEPLGYIPTAELRQATQKCR
jgi:transposase InsO family protein